MVGIWHLRKGTVKMAERVEICMGSSVLECYVVPDIVHDGYGIRIVRRTGLGENREYCCSLGMELESAKVLASHLCLVQATPEDAEELIEDWLFDHREALSQ